MNIYHQRYSEVLKTRLSEYKLEVLRLEQVTPRSKYNKISPRIRPRFLVHNVLNCLALHSAPCTAWSSQLCSKHVTLHHNFPLNFLIYNNNKNPSLISYTIYNIHAYWESQETWTLDDDFETFNRLLTDF